MASRAASRYSEPMTAIGQLFMSGFEGTTLPSDLAHLLRQEALGGVILFRRNIQSVPQLIDLLASIRDAACGRPLLLGVDHEGGRVFRMPPPFTQIPAMAKVAAAVQRTGQSKIAYDVGQLMARELAAVGFNCNFAPVLDINTNPQNPIIGDRAFGGEPHIVSQCGVALMRGLMEGGVIACGKHFPGHGDTPNDSHKSLPVLPHTLERLRWMELKPFADAIAAGAPMLMTAHILYGALDAQNPVTVSRRIITGILREEMGYDGVVITDDLEMGGIIAAHPPEESAWRALAAGCDIALICRNVEKTCAAMERATKAVGDGDLAPGRIARAAARVAALQQRYATPRGDRADIGSAAHRQIVAALQWI